MKKAIRIMATGILCFSMISCAAAGNSPKEVAAENSPEEIDYTTGTPWMYIDLIGNVTADTPADLKDNYALWANKDRILSLKIPEGYSTAGDLVDLTIKANADKKAMFHGPVPENHDAGLAYNYYYLLADWDSRDAAGVTPLKEMIDIVEGIKSLEDMTEYLVNTPGEDRLFDLWSQEARQDPEEPGNSMLSLEKSAFFLLDSAEYQNMTTEGEYHKEVFTTFLQKMLVKLGYSEEEARQKIDNCFAWETMMNSVDPDEEKSDSSEFTNDIDRLYTRDDLKALTPDVPLLETLEKADGYPAMDKYYIPDPVYFERLNALYTEENLPLMRDYLIMQGIWEMADVLDWESYVLVNECSSAHNHEDPLELDTETYPESGAYDRTAWDGFPFGVSCGYEPSVNGIYIYAGFAQGNNYYPGMPDEELYAKIGAAIAHEISHAFDAEGSKYDKDGNMNNWWTEEDRAAFLKKNEKLVAYYNAMHPWEGQDFNGENMKGEACADMAAFKCILRIVAKKEDFDYDKFFRAYADRYACLDSPMMAVTRLIDVHPMNYLRVNGVLQQYDEFLNFYGISEGDTMYLAPEDRVAIW